MAIDITTHECNKIADLPWDPFMLKAQAAEERRQLLIEKFFETGVNGRAELRDTTMVYLVLKCELRLTDEQYMKVLGLDLATTSHSELYQLLLGEIRYLASHLQREVMAHSLMQMPLTDIRKLCYRIADKYESIFYIPARDEDEDDPMSALSFQWLDRFNSMWPIVSLLSREYALAQAAATTDIHFVS